MKDYAYLDPFIIEQLKAGNHSVRGFHVTCHSASITVRFADHMFGKAADIFPLLPGYGGSHGICAQIDRIDYQVSSPMYPTELNSLINADARSKAVLYRAAFNDYYLKVTMVWFIGYFVAPNSIYIYTPWYWNCSCAIL